MPLQDRTHDGVGGALRRHFQVQRVPDSGANDRLDAPRCPSAHFWICAGVAVR